MDISQLTRRALSLPGIESLNAMQEAMAQSAVGGTTVLLAPTGSGKTLAFALAMLRGVEAGAERRPQAVVLVPSRELALQVAETVRRLAAGCKTVAFYGGHSMQEEQATIQGSVPDIVIATPGRLLDHARRANLSLRTVSTLVLDEYDKMLELGFEQEMRQLASKMPSVRRVILTSATRLAQLPAWLPVAGDGGAAVEELDFSERERRREPDKIAVEAYSRDKLDTLVDLLRSMRPDAKAIVFVNHRESAERVLERLRADGIAAGIYHGGMEQFRREDAVELLANGSLPVLVATDLASRGLDIPAVDAVVHYHQPVSAEAWTHRNGRTARQGADGEVFVIFAPEGETVPEYVVTDRSFRPPHDDSLAGPRPQAATLHLNLGRKDKVSKGDIVGYLTSVPDDVPLTGAEIGRITLRDHSALVAVPRDKAGLLMAALAQAKVKGKRVKLTRLA